MITSNRNTTQAPMTALGRTGTQTVKFIPAPRVYVKAPDPVLSAPYQSYAAYSNGQTPAGWVDLGSVNGNVKVTYNQKTKEVRTGIDNYLRAAYLDMKSAQLDFTLAQLDDVVLETISGQAPISSSQGVYANYILGASDLTELAILLIVQNKLDGKEIHFYNPQALISFNFEDASDELGLKCTALAPFFTPAGSTVESALSLTFIAAGASYAPPIFVESFASTSAIPIQHNLNSQTIVPIVTDQFGQPIGYGDFSIVDDNHALLTFAFAMSGTVVIQRYGASNSATQSFTNSMSVPVRHNLGTTNVSAIVYDSNNVEVQYGDLTPTDANNATVTFAMPVTGRVIVYNPAAF